MFLFAVILTPIIPPSPADITVITHLSSVKRVGAEKDAISEIIVKIKNKIPPISIPVKRPFFLIFFAVISPAKNAPMLKERVEQRLLTSIGKTPKDISKAHKINKIEIMAVPIISPKIMALTVLSSKNLLFSKIKTSP